MPKQDADVKGMADFFHIPYETVEVYQPAMWPLLLELTMLVTFGFAFRAIDYDVDGPIEPPRQSWPPNVIPFGIKEDPLITRQEAVNARVAQWIRDEGLPVGSTVKEAHARFNVWLAKQPELVALKAFGIALNYLGVPKRQKGGRTLIANHDYTPRKRKSR